MLKSGRVYKQSSEFRFNLEISRMSVTFTDMTVLKGCPKVHEFITGMNSQPHAYRPVSYSCRWYAVPAAVPNTCNPAPQNLAPLATCRSTHRDLYLGYVKCWV
jgi:hypothetical protein